MKFFKLGFMLALVGLLIVSCQKDDLSVMEKESKLGLRNSHSEDLSDCLIERSRLVVDEQRMLLLSEFIGLKLQERDFKSGLVTEILDREFKQSISSELVLSELFNSSIGGNSSFGDEFEQWIILNYSEEQAIFTDLCQAFDGIVLDLSWWATEIIKEREDFMELSFGSVAAISPVVCGNYEIRTLYTDEEIIRNVKSPFVDIIPIYVKESEELIKDPSESDLVNIINSASNRYAGCILTQEDIVNFMKTVDCSNANYFDIMKFNNFLSVNCSLLMVEICDDGIDNDNDGLIDDEDPDCWEDVEICNNGIDDDGDGLIDQQDEEDCPCEISCQRDCLIEDNVITGLKFEDSGMLNVITTLDENNIWLEYTWAIVKICDSQTNGTLCDQFDEFNNTSVVQGSVQEFFELNTFVSEEDFAVGELGIVFIEELSWPNTRYHQAWPLYVPIGMPYLQSLPYNQWNGDLIGSRIKYKVMEKDNSQINQTLTVGSSSQVSHSFDASVTAGFDIFDIGLSAKTGYKYSSAVGNTQQSATQIRYDQAVDVTGDRYLYYCDQDEFYPDPTENPSGNWYGIIPSGGFSNGAGLYEEIRVKR